MGIQIVILMVILKRIFETQGSTDQLTIFAAQGLPSSNQLQKEERDVEWRAEEK